MIYYIILYIIWYIILYYIIYYYILLYNDATQSTIDCYFPILDQNLFSQSLTKIKKHWLKKNFSNPWLIFIFQSSTKISMMAS